MGTGGVSVVPPDTAAVTSGVSLPDNAGKLHRCTVGPIDGQAPFDQRDDFDLAEARRYAQSQEAQLISGTAFNSVRQKVRQEYGASGGASTPNPWRQASARRAGGLGGLLALSLKFSLFGVGRADYTAEVSPVLRYLDQGRPASAGKYLAAGAAEAAAGVENPEDLASGIGTLGLLERGSVHLAAGDRGCARTFFDNAVEALRRQAEGGTMADQVWDVLADDYGATGFESVMSVNYQAITEFLDNDPRVANNVRLSRAWQQREREEYQEELRAARQDLRREKEKQVPDSASSAFDDLQSTFTSKLDSACLACEDIADRVETPYVNPLADFLSAAWSEHRAARAAAVGDQPTFTAAHSNALTAYKNAADLRSDNGSVSRAIDELQARQSRIEREGGAPVMNAGRDRLVHVVMDVGRAPERRIAKLLLPIGYSTFVPLQVPYYQPVDKTIDTIRIKTPSGKTVQEIEPLADVEAMAMQHFQDNLPLHLGKATAAAVANYVIQIKTQDALGGGALGKLGGALTGMMAAELTEPGTESWTTMPHNVGVARLRVPGHVDSLQVVGYAANGRELSRERIELWGDGPAFVYGRGIADHLSVMASDPRDAPRLDQNERSLTQSARAHAPRRRAR